MMKKLEKFIEQKTNEVNSKSFHKASSHWQGFLIKYKFMNGQDILTYLRTLKKQLEASKSTVELTQFRDKLFKNVGRANFVFVGPLDKDTCYGIVSLQSDVVSQTSASNKLNQEFVKLKDRLTEINIPNINPVETQTAIINSQQIEFSSNMHKDVILAYLLKSKFEHSIFAELRTKHQVGYVCTFKAIRFGDSLNI